MADFFDCTNIGKMSMEALLNALIVQLPDGTKAFRTIAVSASCGTADDALNCSNNGFTDVEAAFKSVIGVDPCGKPAIRLATSS
jgi:hypothetical protein